VSPSWSSHFNASRTFCNIKRRSWWLRTTASMAVNSWNGLASKMMFSVPTVISLGFSVVGFLPASFRTTSRIFFDFSAKVRISSSFLRYSPNTLLVSDNSLSKPSAIACADVYSFIWTTMFYFDLHKRVNKRKGNLGEFLFHLTPEF
jgi:hypothetical protein